MNDKKKETTKKTDDFDVIHEKLNKIDMDLSLVKQSLMGSKAYGHKGVIERINEHEDYIKRDSQLKAKFIGATLVFGSFWTLLLKFWDKIF